MKAIVPEFKSQNSRFEKLDAATGAKADASSDAATGAKAVMPGAVPATPEHKASTMDSKAAPFKANRKSSKSDDHETPAPIDGKGSQKKTPVPANGESLQPDALASVDIDAPHF
jgi:hypothetical protein